MMRGLGRTQHVKVTQSWLKWNRKLPGLRPGRYFQSRPRVLVLGDTSGSINSTELNQFMREINGLTRRSMIDLAWVDAHFDPNDKNKGGRPFDPII